MFEQSIKSEPMGFYSTCPPPPQMTQPQPQPIISRPEQSSEQSVIPITEEKDNSNMPQSLIVVSYVRLNVFISILLHKYILNYGLLHQSCLCDKSFHNHCFQLFCVCYP